MGHLYSLIRISILVLLVSNLVLAQKQDQPVIKKVDHSEEEWYLEVQKEMPNYNRVENLYNAYFHLNPYERSPQKNQVRRWLMTNHSIMDDEGYVQFYHTTKEDLQKLEIARKKARKKQKSSKAVLTNKSIYNPPNSTWNDSVGTWRMIGPYHNRTHNMFGGFNDRVFINRFNLDNMIAGQSYGGLWTTQDGGATWKLTDAEYPNGKNTYANRDMYYGEIEVHPLDHKRIIVGSEAGVLISNDAGESWNLVDELNYIDKPTERSYFIAQKNDDTNVILASYGTKIYRTSDGGSNWNVVFDNSAVTHRRSTYQHGTIGVYHRWYNFAGLEFDHNNSNIVYLAAINSNNETCLYKSTDAGLTFSLLVNTGITKWVKMVHSPSEPDRINFANIFINLKTPNADEGIRKFDENGNVVSFNPYPALSNANLLDDIMQSQTDADTWVTSGYASSKVFYSNDGGISYNTSMDNTHADLRAFSIVGDTVLIGTDGGLHISYDGGATLQEASQWISAIDLWGFSSAFKGELLAAGDDHGPTEFRIKDEDRSWHRTGGADSEHVQINRVDQNFAYGRDVYSPFLGEKINDSTFVRRGNFIPDGNFKYLAQDPDESYRFYPINANILKESADNMVTQTDLKVFSKNIQKAEVVLKNNRIIYVLEDRKTIHKTTDGGVSWNIITPASSVTNGRTLITDIETDETGEQVWLSYGQNQTDCKVVYSNNGGLNWVNITGNNLPSFAVEHITYQRGTDGMVYIGLKPGTVWYKSNTDMDWSLLGSDLPMISYITTMYTVPDMGKLRMGSSRGAWEHDLAISSHVGAHFSTSSRQAKACDLDTIKFFDYSSYYGETTTSFLWTFEGGTPSVSTEMNPRVVYKNPGIYDVSLTVTDINGESDTYTREDFMTVLFNDNCGPGTDPGYAMNNVANYHYASAPPMDLQNQSSYTMMAWVKGEGQQRDYAGILSHSLSAGSVHLNVRAVGQDSTELGYHHPNGQWWWSSGLYLKPGEWTHVALVVEPTGISIFKNGKGSKHNRTVAAHDFVNSFRVGGMIGRNDRAFKGMIDEVAFYKRALTSHEIRTMMHLTKENEKYPLQHDSDLISYFQFNDPSSSEVLELMGSGNNLSFTSQVEFVNSDGPFGGGQSKLLNISSSGNYNFDEPGLQLEFGNTHPNGNIVVSHIENLPDTLPMNTFPHENGYYIINNYGLNQNFDPLIKMQFNKTGTVSNELVNVDGGFKIWKRPTNMHDQSFNEIINNDISLNAGNYGTLIVNDASPVNNFSQFLITRNSYPERLPKISMVSDNLLNQGIEGGESISGNINSENQGMKLPILNAAQLMELGLPLNGSIAFYEDSSSILIFEDGNWKQFKTTPIINISNGAIAGTKTISIGGDLGIIPSSIVAVADSGFVRMTGLSDFEILNINYPTAGLMVYNLSINQVQIFNGSHWISPPLSPTNITVSTNPMTKLSGVKINGTNEGNNVLLEDLSTNAALRIPSLSAENIMDPIKGLFIYDTSRKCFLFHDGQYWNKIIMQ